MHTPTNQVSYAIGVAEPLSITVFDYGTGTKSSQELMKIVRENFDLRSAQFISNKENDLDFPLTRPVTGRSLRR